MTDMEVEYSTNDVISPAEMLSLAEAVGFGPHRSLERNKKAIKGSAFTASARYENQLIGLIRLISDGAYVLHIADMMVHRSFQKKGVGMRLLNSAIDYAKEQGIGTGDDFGEFTLFANLGAEDFYSKSDFISMPNGMVFANSEARRKIEQKVKKYWQSKRK